MHRRPPRSIGTVRDIVPASGGACRGCMDLMCKVCWGDASTAPYDDPEAMDVTPPLRLLVELDDATYAALDATAAGLGVSVGEAAAAVLAEWADRNQRRR